MPDKKTVSLYMEEDLKTFLQAYAHHKRISLNQLLIDMGNELKAVLTKQEYDQIIEAYKRIDDPGSIPLDQVRTSDMLQAIRKDRRIPYTD